MKRNIAALLFGAGLAAVPAAAAEVPADTISTFSRPDSVSISHDGARLKVEVFGKRDNPDYYYSYQRVDTTPDEETLRETSSGDSFAWRIPFVDKNSEEGCDRRPARFDLETGGFGIGFVSAAGAPEAMDVKMKSSIELFWDRILSLRVSPWRNRTSFVAGVGVAWRNYRMKGDLQFAKDGDVITFAPYKEGATPSFSRLKIFSLTVPVLISQGFGKGFAADFGAIVNFNLHGSMKTKYELDGEERVWKDNHINQKPVTVDLMLQLNWHPIGVYVKYSPMKTLKSGFGPEFNHISTGITLFY